jgi:hypothetical protein
MLEKDGKPLVDLPLKETKSSENANSINHPMTGVC